MALLQEIIVPLLAVNDTTLTVVELLFAGGAKVEAGDVVMVFETSKTTFDVVAETNGYVQYLFEADRDYEVNAVVARIFSEAAEALMAPARTQSPAAQPFAQDQPASSRRQKPAFAREQDQPLPRWDGETIFSRAARELMAQQGVDPVQFAGMDFVTAGDVGRLLQPAAAETPRATAATIQATAETSQVTARAASSGKENILAVDLARAVVEKLTSAKKREIDYLGTVQSAGLTSTVHTYVETDGIFLRLNRAFQYLRDSLLPVIIYETARLLVDYPLLNAYYTGKEIALYREVNPGFAIDIDKGLKVLKVAGAGQMTMTAIEKEILRLSNDYLDDKLSLDALTDITFTITDLSAEGVTFFQPLVNRMNSAVLGVSAIDRKLQRCMLSLTFDHRVTEGKLVARFLQELRERIESYRPPAGAARPDISCFKCLKTLEEDLAGTGFVRCVTPEGKDGYICQTCFKGF